MKFTDSQKGLYQLAAALLVIAVALAGGWMLWGGGESMPDVPLAPAATPTPSPSPDADAQVSAGAGETEQKQTVSTVVYYQDNYGYLVPVMCNVEKQDGIAKATLNMMVKSPQNDMNAARLGLRTVLPENTVFDLDITGGLARIDLSREVLDLPDAAAENSMVNAVVQTLTEFETVERVEFLVGGRKIDKLTHGTDISQPFARGEINPESSVASASSGGLEPVKLYFPCESGSVVVPVTRMVYSRPDVNTAVLELAKGPSTLSPLEGTLPAGCGLIDVKVEGGVARVNFTREFADLVENTDGGRLALKALVLTCTQFEGIEEVEIFVEGEAYDPGAGALSAPSFANVADDIIYNYIQAQSGMIFDFE